MKKKSESMTKNAEIKLSDKLWFNHISQHLPDGSFSLGELNGDGSRDPNKATIYKAKKITLDSTVSYKSNTTIICEEFIAVFAAINGPATIVMENAADELQIIARKVIGEVNVEGPGRNGKNGDGGQAGDQGITGLDGNIGRKGKSASTFHSAKRGKSGGLAESGNLGGLGTEGGGATAGGDGRDVTVVAESFEPGTVLNVIVPGGNGGNGGFGGKGGQGGSGGKGGAGGKGGDGFKPFHRPARGGRGGLGGSGGDGRNGNNGGPGGSGGDGGNLTVFFLDPANIPVVNFDADGGVGGAGGPGGAGGLGGSGGRGGDGGLGGDGGDKPGIPGGNGVDGAEGLPGQRGPDGNKGEDGELNLVWQQKPLPTAESFVALAALALDETQTARTLGVKL